MKKAIVLVLALVLVLGLGVYAFAELDPVSIESPVGADGKDLLISATAAQYELVRSRDAAKLSAEEQKVFEDSFQALEEAIPENMVARYFFHLNVSEPCDAVFNVDGALNPVFMQYVDGAWVTLEIVANADQTVTVKNVVDAPMAILFPAQ